MEAGKAQDSNLKFYDTISRRGEKKESTAIKQRENIGGAIMERQYDYGCNNSRYVFIII